MKSLLDCLACHWWLNSRDRCLAQGNNFLRCRCSCCWYRRFLIFARFSLYSIISFDLAFYAKVNSWCPPLLSLPLSLLSFSIHRLKHSLAFRNLHTDVGTSVLLPLPFNTAKNLWPRINTIHCRHDVQGLRAETELKNNNPNTWAQWHSWWLSSKRD